MLRDFFKLLFSTAGAFLLLSGASGSSDSDVGHFSFPDGVSNLLGGFQDGTSLNSYFLGHFTELLLKKTRVTTAVRSGDDGVWTKGTPLKSDDKDIDGNRATFTGGSLFKGNSGVFTDPYGLLIVNDSKMKAYGMDSSSELSGTIYGSISFPEPSTGVTLADAILLNLNGRTNPTIVGLLSDCTLNFYDITKSSSEITATLRGTLSPITSGNTCYSLASVNLVDSNKSATLAVYVGVTGKASSIVLMSATCTDAAGAFTLTELADASTQLVGIDFSRIKSIFGSSSAYVYGTTVNPSEEAKTEWRTSFSDPFEVTYDTTTKILGHKLGTWISGDDYTPIEASTKLTNEQCGTSISLGTIATRSQLRFGADSFDTAAFSIEFHNGQNENLSFTYSPKTSGASSWSDGMYGTVKFDRTGVIGALAGDATYTFHPTTSLGSGEMVFDIIVDRHSVIFSYRDGEAAGVVSVDHDSYFDKVCLYATAGNVNILPTSKLTHLTKQVVDSAAHFSITSVFLSLIIATASLIA